MQKIIDVNGTLRSLWADLCKLIYKLIAFLYELFMNVAGVKILAQDGIKPIYQRVTMILAIIMVFYVTLEVVKYVLQPEKMTDKEKGASNIVKNMIIVVVLIAFVPTIFEKAYDLQNSLLRNQVLSKIILGRESNDMQKLGREFSAQMFGMFYYYDDEFWKSNGKNPEDVKCDDVVCSTVVQMNISSLATDGTLPYIDIGLNEEEDVTLANGKKQKVRCITFDGLLAVAVGIFIAWILILYCVDVGVRVIQLVFLQVIAPIPIIGYLTPKKDGIFQKWVKQCITTYLDLFIRLALICFIMLIIEILGNAYHSSTLINNVGDVSRTMKTYMYIAIIMGLLLFAKKAPKMLQELFPKMGAASGNLGFKASERVAPLAARAIGGSLGLARGLVRGGVRRAAWRRARNKANGWTTGIRGLYGEGKANNKQKREEARKNKQALKTARRQHRNLTQDKEAKDNFDAARTAYQEKVKNNARIQELTKQIREESDEGRRKELGTELEKEYKKLENTDEYKNWKAARKKLSDSATVQNIRTENRKRHQEKENILNQQEKAKNELDEALASGDPNRIAAAQKKKNEVDKAAKEKLDKIAEDEKKQKDQTNNFLNTNIDEQIKETEQQRTNAEEQVTIDKNKHFQGLAGSVGSTLVGAGHAFTTGAQATKLEDIRKKVQQADKNDIANVRAVQQYYDAGGTGTINRTIQQVEKRVGMPTEYERTVLESKRYDIDIKNYGSQAALAKSFSTQADNSENRFIKKAVDANKIAAIADESGHTRIKTGLKDANNNDIYATVEYPGEKLGSLVRRYDQAALDAHTSQEQATKNYDSFVANNIMLLNDEAILNNDRNSLNADQQKHYDDVKNAVEQRNILENTKKKASQEESNAKYAAEQVNKNVGRFLKASVLQRFANGDTMDNIKKANFDGAGVEMVYDELERLRLMRENPDMVNEMRKRLSQENFEMFMSGKIAVLDENNEWDSQKSWDAADTINNTAKSVMSEYERQKSNLEEKKRKTETSYTTISQRADNDFNPNGGK